MKWEYSVMNAQVNTMSSEHMKDFLDEMGKFGWELIYVNGTRHIFKRPDNTDEKKKLLTEDK